MLQNNTAILIFANTPEQEILEKTFGNGLNKAQQLHLAEALLNYTRKVALASGLPIVEILSSHQQGNTFAERYTQAITQVFDLGYDKVISIGTDCPGLQTANILDAHGQLQHTQAVLGLAYDGGNYLIALDKQAFDAAKFQALPWQTSLVAQALVQYFKIHQAQVAFLATKKTDIDNVTQLYQAFRELPTYHSLFSLFQQLLVQFLSLIAYPLIAHKVAQFRYLFGLRAPPLPSIL